MRSVRRWVWLVVFSWVLLIPVGAHAAEVSDARVLPSLPFAYEDSISTTSHVIDPTPWGSTLADTYPDHIRYNAHRIQLTAGTFYQFTVTAPRAIVMIVDATGNELMPIPGWGPDDRMQCFRPAVSGTYYVCAGTAQYLGESIPYTLEGKVVQAGRVSGKVTNTSGQPLVGHIRFNFTSGNIPSVLDVQTEADGTFISSYLPVGEYELEVNEFIDGHIGQVVAGVQIRAGQTTVVNAALSKGGTITGTVRGSNGLPLDGRVWVRAFQIGQGEICLTDNWVNGDVLSSHLARNSEDGYFEFVGLPEGRYVVTYGIENWDPTTGQLGVIRDYSYYNRAEMGSQYQADAVVVTGESVVSGVDGRLSETPGKVLRTAINITGMRDPEEGQVGMAVVGTMRILWSAETASLTGQTVYLDRSMDGGKTWSVVSSDTAPRFYQSWGFDYRPTLSYRVRHLLRIRYDGIPGVFEGCTSDPLVAKYPEGTVTTLSAPGMRWDGSTLITGYVRTRDEVPLAGKKVLLERSFDAGRTWPDMKTVTTGPDGKWAYSYNPGSSSERVQKLRARFLGDDTYVKSSSAPHDLTVTATLWKPTLSVAAPKRNQKFTVSGYIAPRFKVGTQPARAYFYRKTSGGDWEYRSYVKLNTSQYSSTKTKLYASTSLPSSGEWRVRVRYDGARTYTGYELDRTYSSYQYFTVVRQ